MITGSRTLRSAEFTALMQIFLMLNLQSSDLPALIQVTSLLAFIRFYAAPSAARKAHAPPAGPLPIPITL